MVLEKLKSVYRRFWGSPFDQRSYETLSVRQSFRKIYSTKVWGDNGQPFYSGPGSHGPIADQYSAAVAAFIKDHGVRSVVDCGCGDFSIGGRIVEATAVQYTGVDVVDDLIEHHKKTVQNSRVSFLCADLTRDPLPSADLYLIRQVLQHLANREIAKVLGRVGDFPMTLISEHVPMNLGSINDDMSHGPEVRSDYNSAVFVDQPPFSIAAKELWNFPMKDGILRTVLIERNNSAGPS
jgi:SAM-dependent methyltransferase